MNRLSPLTGLGSKKSARSAEGLDCSILSTNEVSGLRHAVFAPLHYEPNYAYPLIVWLHGPGTDERQLQRIMPLVSMRNYLAVAPRAPWRDAASAGFNWQCHAQATSLVADMIFECVELVAEQYHFARNRIFLAGHQTGGELALRIALQNPRAFAGVVSIGGAFPRAGQPLTKLDDARALPILIAHSRDSQQYTLNQICDDLRLFHAAGMFVTLRQYSCGDQIHQYMLRDMNIWLMEQVTGQEFFDRNYYSPGSHQAN